MLEEIVASVRSRLAPVIAAEDRHRAAAAAAPAARPFGPALAAGGLSVIAEVKRRSPSRGVIDANLDPAGLAARYEQGGAAAVSILTEPDHFSGTLDDLRQARAAIGLPVLRKDFILHPSQIWEARAAGADAVLLIVALLADGDLSLLLGTAGEAGLDALVEVHTPTEADRALASGAGIVGVNNRDLTTFEVDLATAEQIRPRLGDGVAAVAESGVADPEGAARMADAGYDAILVGEAAVRSGNPSGFVAALREPR